MVSVVTEPGVVDRILRHVTRVGGARPVRGASAAGGGGRRHDLTPVARRVTQGRERRGVEVRADRLVEGRKGVGRTGPGPWWPASGRLTCRARSVGHRRQAVAGGQRRLWMPPRCHLVEMG